MDLIMIVLASVLGLVIGSFLNVLIYRIPKEESIIWPASHCPKCKSLIKWYDNIPVLSYIILRAKCRNCKQIISPRYPAIELLTGVLSGLFAWHIGCENYLWLAVALIAVYSIIVLSFIDIDHMIIPDRFSLGLIVLGLATCFVNPNFSGPWYIKLLYSFIGAGGGFAVMVGIAFLGEFLFKKEAMGGGDIKLMAGAGALLGLQGFFSVILIGSLIGAVFGVVQILAKKLTRSEPFPFGPFLGAAMIINLYQLIPLSTFVIEF